MRARMITGTLKKICEVYKSRPFCEWILEFFEYFLESQEFYENARKDDNLLIAAYLCSALCYYLQATLLDYNFLGLDTLYTVCLTPIIHTEYGG